MPDGHLVRHSCDYRPCCNPAHLKAGTQKDNHDDARLNDRHTRGERCRKKLSDGDVVEIRRRFKRYDKVNGGRALATEFGVSEAMIHLILAGKAWTHVDYVEDATDV